MTECDHNWTRIRNGHDNRYRCTRCERYGFKGTRCNQPGSGACNPHSPRAVMRVAHCAHNHCRKDATVFKGAKVWCDEHGDKVRGYEPSAHAAFMEDKAVDDLFAEARRAAGL